MKKSEIILELSKETGLNQVAVKRVVEGLVDIIIKTIKKEKRCPLTGLGIFHLVKRAKRTCHNPQTGKLIEVKAHGAVTFAPSRAVKNYFL
ncbi:MAG: HU family DNA-binding protein [Deltaproteobacteria bacterium]|jgi:DNA-binding protein HU-beta|nr:HU family DNA-binding protein [Deltaproteobacteria bacterium]